jgi:hypothetical protein
MAPARSWFAAVLVLGCAASKPEALYQRGVDAFAQDQMAPAVEALEAFVGRACGPARPDPRCREGYLKLGHAHERLGAPAAAWAAYDAALTFGPHTRDAAVQADLERTHQELLDRNGHATERAPLIVRYRDEVGDEYNPRSVVILLDFDPVLTKDKDASELHSADFRRVYGASVPAGEHVLIVETIHDCKPGGAGRCTRSHVHKAWPFRNAAHTPTTIEIRAYGEEGTGDGPARPAIELIAR